MVVAEAVATGSKIATSVLSAILAGLGDREMMVKTHSSDFDFLSPKLPKKTLSGTLCIVQYFILRFYSLLLLDGRDTVSVGSG